MKTKDGELVKNRILSNRLEAKRWPYLLMLPITELLVVWVIIKKKVFLILSNKRTTGLLVFDGIGKYGEVIKQNVAGWKAVDLIYNHQFKKNRTLGGRLDDFWFNSLNCQAVRNRFKLAKTAFEKAIFNLPDQKEIRVISLAAGTGQIESETIVKVKNLNFKLKIILIDKEINALIRAKEIIASNNLTNEIKVVNSDVKYVLDVANKFKPQIIKMVAFMEYLPKEEAISFISKICKILPEDGYFITSNTMPNIEMHFVKWIVGWPLIYRNPKQIGEILKTSGFIQHEIISDPLGIQNIVIARKKK